MKGLVRHLVAGLVEVLNAGAGWRLNRCRQNMNLRMPLFVWHDVRPLNVRDAKDDIFKFLP